MGWRGRPIFLSFLLLWVVFIPKTQAVEVAELDPAQEWKMKDLKFSGNKVFSDDSLLQVFQTKPKKKFLVFKQSPPFDPTVFLADLEQLKLFYETHGYYGANIRYDLRPDPNAGTVSPLIVVDEGQPVILDKIDILIDRKGGPGSSSQHQTELEAVKGLIGIHEGEPFDQQKYRQAQAHIKRWYLEKGYARVRVERRADVYLNDKRAIVQYRITPGPVCFFGTTRIEGLKRVKEDILRREIAYLPGEPFALSKLKRTRRRLVELGLFQMVRFEPEPEKGAGEEIVDLKLSVIERPPRDLRLSLGYSTEEGIRTQVGWEHLNFMGGARRASLSAEYSSLTRKFSGSFLNPHFPAFHSRTILDFSQYDDDEDTYMLYATRVAPRIEHDFFNHFTGILGYRVEYARHTDVNPLTRAAIGGLDMKGVVSGPSLGLRYDSTDDPLDPKKGNVLGFYLDSSLEPFGGEYAYYRMIFEGKHFRPFWFKTTLATKLKVGMADPIGNIEHYPLYERFYPGGQASVRGYERRRLGPIGKADDPLGGLSLVEGSLELRRSVWNDIAGAIFLDFGQASMKTFDPPFGSLDFGTGVGASYKSPIGPIRVDLGFPFDPPEGDRGWQVYFSIGHMF